MNSPLDEGQLVSFEHMNRAQKRAFILRDQLKYEEEQHLDVFIDGIRNPEPPRYKRTANGVQPPCEEVTIKHSTTRFDLGNVEFSDKSVRRVFLVCAGDSYEMHESDAISPDEDDFNSVPLNYYVAQKIMPSFKKKYEAIHARVQRINELRQHMYDQASNRPLKAPSRFKEGKSLAKLMDSTKNPESIQNDEASRKRLGDPITRHPLNKKKRISLDNVSSNTKTEAVNQLPDQTKVELFNAFVKSAFPDFDNLLMASWNVVSIFVNVGSEDLMLHNSIGDLHDVLLRFDDYFGKSKKRPNFPGAAGPRNDARNGSVRSTPLAQGLGTLDGSGEVVSRDYARDRLVELPARSHTAADEGVYVLPTDSPATGSRLSNNRYEAERRPLDNLRHHRTSLDQQQTQSPARQPTAADDTATKQLASRARPEPRPQSLSDLLTHKPPKDVRRGAAHAIKAMAASIEEDAVSSIETGYTTAHTQKPQTPPTLQAPDTPSPHTPKPTPAHSPASATPRRPEPATLSAAPADHRTRMPPLPPPNSQAQREAQRYGMFSGRTRRSSLDALFVGSSSPSSDGEAVQVPAMQEVHEQEKADEPRTGGLGRSMLGAPKKPLNATGSAPVALMVHNSSAGKKGV